MVLLSTCWVVPWTRPEGRSFVFWFTGGRPEIAPRGIGDHGLAEAGDVEREGCGDVDEAAGCGQHAKRDDADRKQRFQECQHQRHDCRRRDDAHDLECVERQRKCLAREIPAEAGAACFHDDEARRRADQAKSGQQDRHDQQVRDQHRDALRRHHERRLGEMKARVDVGLGNRLKQPGKGQDRHDRRRGLPELAAKDHAGNIAARQRHAGDGRQYGGQQNFEAEFQMRPRLARAAGGVGAHRQRDRCGCDAHRRNQDDLPHEIGGRAVLAGCVVAHEMKHQHPVERGVDRKDDARQRDRNAEARKRPQIGNRRSGDGGSQDRARKQRRRDEIGDGHHRELA